METIGSTEEDSVRAKKLAKAKRIAKELIQIRKMRAEEASYQKMVTYFKEKTLWYMNQFQELKNLTDSTQTTPSECERWLPTKIEGINSELGIDTTVITARLLESNPPAMLKAIEDFRGMLSTISYRVRFYADTHMRGI